MSTQTKPALPESITLAVVNKWLDRSDEKHPQIRFILKISNGGQSMQCDYSGGILAFKNNRNLNIYASRPVKTVADKETWESAIQQLFQSAKPDLHGVLRSLIMDAQAGEQSFMDFCGECGYDEDSRKAYSTWEACQKIGSDVRRVLGPLFSEVNEALRDY